MVEKKHGITDCEIGDDLTCVHCGFKFRRQTSRRECPVIRVDQAALVAKRLSWASRLSTYAEALARWFAAGRPRRSQQRIDELLEVCRGCPKYRGGACSSCGCRVNASSIGVLNKLAMATESCPESKWLADHAEPVTESQSLRVGFVLPCLMLGGVESWLWSIIRHWDAESGVSFSGVALTSGSLSPEMVAIVNELGPVVAPIEGPGVTQAPNATDAIHALGRVSDVLVVWGISGDHVLAAKSTGKPIVGVIHAVSDWWTPQAAPYVDYWVSVHEVAARSVPAGKAYQLIGNGVDVERCQSTLTRTQARKRLGVPADARVFGYVGRFSSSGEKRHKEIAKALEHLPDDWWCVMAGGGRPDQVPEPHPRLRIVPATRQIGDVMRACDIGVIASEHESWCLVADEWHAAGVPLISTRVGAIVDAVQWLPDRPVAEQIAHAIRSAYAPSPGLRPERTSEAMSAAWSQFCQGLALTDAGS